MNKRNHKITKATFLKELLAWVDYKIRDNDCEACQGQGETIEITCSKTGRYIRRLCKECNGTGKN